LEKGRESTPFSAYALHDPHVALHRVAQGFERLLIGRAIVRIHRLLYAVELDEHRALIDPLLIDLRGVAPGKKAGARCLDRRPGKLRVSRQCVGVLDRVVADYPIGFDHRSLLSSLGIHFMFGR